MNHYQLLISTWPGGRGKIHLDASCPRREGEIVHHLAARDVVDLYQQNRTCTRSECQSSMGLASARYALDLDQRIDDLLEKIEGSTALTIALHEHTLKIISSEVAGLLRKGHLTLDPAGLKDLSKKLKAIRKEWKERSRTDTYHQELLAEVERLHGNGDHVVFAARFETKVRPFNVSQSGRVLAAIIGGKSTEGFILQGSRGAMHWLSTGLGSGMRLRTTYSADQIASHAPLDAQQVETLEALYTPAGHGRLRSLDEALEALSLV